MINHMPGEEINIVKERGSRTIFLADCQSFYTSVEKTDNPAYQHKSLVVAGDPALRSGVILATCPLAKKHGISTAERLGEAVKNVLTLSLYACACSIISMSH